MEYREEIIAALPPIRHIKSEKLRDQVIRAWELAIERGNWACNLVEIPFNEKITWIPLVCHTTNVAILAEETARRLYDAYEIPLDMDAVIAISILHDVCKILEMQLDQEGKIEKSEIGKLYPHGTMSFYLAKEAGLPEKICHAILTHTAQCKMTPSTIEGLLVRYVDGLDADILYVTGGFPSLMSKNH